MEYANKRDKKAITIYCSTGPQSLFTTGQAAHFIVRCSIDYCSCLISDSSGIQVSISHERNRHLDSRFNGIVFPWPSLNWYARTKFTSFLLHRIIGISCSQLSERKKDAVDSKRDDCGAFESSRLLAPNNADVMMFSDVATRTSGFAIQEWHRSSANAQRITRRRRRRTEDLWPTRSVCGRKCPSVSGLKQCAWRSLSSTHDLPTHRSISHSAYDSQR